MQDPPSSGVDTPWLFLTLLREPEAVSEEGTEGRWPLWEPHKHPLTINCTTLSLSIIDCAVTQYPFL